MPGIEFIATLRRPGGKDKGAEWTFLSLPIEASEKLPTRSMVSVEGKFSGVEFASTLEPDGEGGHWMRVPTELSAAARVEVGDSVEISMAPAAVEPEPVVPPDLSEALAESTDKARETWKAITPLARRDWIFWIVSGKKAETRVKRLGVAISKLSAGSRRPCCFDRSGMYGGKSLSCPIAEDE